MTTFQSDGKYTPENPNISSHFKIKKQNNIFFFKKKIVRIPMEREKGNL